MGEIQENWINLGKFGVLLFQRVFWDGLLGFGEFFWDDFSMDFPMDWVGGEKKKVNKI